MAKRNALYSLIKSLSPTEKRHFRLFTHSDKDTNHIKLFNAIDRMGVYDEKKLRQQFSNEKFANQLHVTKNYLSNLILRSLRNYHKNFSRHAELLDILHNVEILHSKGLYDYCQSEINRGLKIASDYEVLELEGLLHNWSIHVAQSLRSHNIPTFRKLIDSEVRAYKRLVTNCNYKHVMLDCMEAWTKQDPNHKKIGDLLAGPVNADTMKGNAILYNSKFVQLITAGKDEEAIDCLSEFLVKLEQNPKLVKETPGAYLVPANNLIFNYVRLGKIEEGLEMVKRIENLKFKLNQKAVLGHWIKTQNLKMTLFKSGCLFREKAEEIKELEALFNKYKIQMSRESFISFSLLFGIYYCATKRPAQALEWLKPVVDFPDPSVSPKTQISVRLLELVVQFELKNYFLLPYHVDKTKRFIKKNDQIQPYQKVLLKFMKRIANTPEGEFREAFKKLHEKMNPEDTATIKEPFTIDCLDFNYWIRSKFEHSNALFAEVTA